MRKILNTKKTKQKKLTFLAVGLVGLAMLGGFLAINTTSVEAATCDGASAILYGRNASCGYFYNSYVTSGYSYQPTFPYGKGDLFPLGIYATNVDQFINIVRARLTDGVVPGGNSSASFLVLTMLGRPAGSAKLSGPSDSRFVAWEQRVREYANTPGRINFNYMTPYQCGTLNTRQVWASTVGAMDANAYLTSYAYNGDCGTSVVKPSIAFFNSAGGLEYVIKKDCGNPIKHMNPLRAIDRAPTATIDRPTCTAVTIRLSDPDTPTRGTYFSLAASVNGGAYSQVVAGYTPMSGVYTFNIPQDANFTTVNRVVFRVVAVSNYPNGTLNSNISTSAVSSSVGPCSVPSCLMTNFPDTMLVASPARSYPYTIGVRLSSPISPAPITSVTLRVKNPAGTVTTSTVPVSTTNNQDFRSGTLNISPTVAGRYEIQWTSTSSAGTVNCPGPTTATWERSDAGDQPYFEVVGGDIMAGMSNGSSGKTINPNLALIMAWNSNTSADKFAGGKTNLAAIARGDINGFVTGDLTVSGPSVLALANTAASNPIYGGKYDGALDRPDYIGTALNRSDIKPCPIGVIDVGLLESGTYQCSRNVSINGTIGNNKNITILITNASAFIGGNIEYANTGNLYTIPSFNLYVDEGNIVVNSGVTSIRGVYVAQSDESGKGNFYSCGRSATYPITYELLASDLTTYPICNRQLTINGSVVADHLVLSRTYGSWARSASGAAEVFKYSPEVWLGSEDPAAGTETFDSFISLPPVL